MVRSRAKLAIIALLRFDGDDSSLRITSTKKHGAKADVRTGINDQRSLAGIDYVLVARRYVGVALYPGQIVLKVLEDLKESRKIAFIVSHAQFILLPGCVANNDSDAIARLDTSEPIILLRPEPITAASNFKSDAA